MIQKLQSNIQQELKLIDFRYILLLILPVLSIFIYGKYRCDNYHKNYNVDRLEFNLFKNSHKFGLDGWSITHFTLFFIIGFLYPQMFFTTITLGLLWELFETFIGIYKPNFIKDFGFCKLSDNKYKVWWYGKWSDIIVNLIGFLCGAYIKKNYF